MAIFVLWLQESSVAEYVFGHFCTFAGKCLHRDVVLSFFSTRKKEVLSLFGGDQLIYNSGYLVNPKTGNYIAKLSTRMRDNLTQWEEKGYHVVSSSVRFVVAWRAKEESKDIPETAVLLPEIQLLHEQATP